MARREAGFTLIEIMITTLLVGVVVVSVSTLFMLAMKVNSAAADHTECATLAQHRLEALRRVEFDTLVLGGSVSACSTGYCEYLDQNSDARNDYMVSWAVERPSGPSADAPLSAAGVDLVELKVRCQPLRSAQHQSGNLKQVLLQTYRTDF